MNDRQLKRIAGRREERERVRARFFPLFDRVAAILYRLDPIRINFAVNPHEYEPEAESILPRLACAACEAEALDIIHEEFVHWFGKGIAGPPQRYEAAAAEIWAAWLEWKE